MSAMACSICGGSPEEHGPHRSIHVYTEQPGELRTERQAQEEMARRSSSRVMLAPPADSGPVARLVQLMMAKNLLTPEEALYVMMGVDAPKTPGKVT